MSTLFLLLGLVLLAAVIGAFWYELHSFPDDDGVSHL